MTNAKIFKKSIEKAINNGYFYADWKDKVEFLKYLKTLDFKCIIENDGYQKIIFSHEFLKAYFGNARIERNITQEEYYEQLLKRKYSKKTVNFYHDGDELIITLKLPENNGVYLISKEIIKKYPLNVIKVAPYTEEWDNKKEQLYTISDEIVTSYDTLTSLIELKPWTYCPNFILDTLMERDGYCKRYNHGWEYHAQQMALEEDRLKYLEKFL